MIFDVKKLIKIKLLLLYFVTLIEGECRITYPSNPSIQPHLIKRIGLRTITISNSNQRTTIPNNQEIIASCNNKFEQPIYFRDKSQLHLRCTNEYIYIGSSREPSNIYLECAPLKSNLYELFEKFVWCPSNLASYILSRPHASALYNYKNLAGICYDTHTMALTSIYYNMAPKNCTDLEPSALTNNNFTLRVDIDNVKETFEPKSVTSENYDNTEFQHWIEFGNYQYNSTIQNPILYNEVYNEFGSLLDFQWWPNLRLGNWHFYEEALAKHIENESRPYDILAGISGVVMAPVKESCQNNYTMKIVIDNSNNKIPLYVWNYLNPAFEEYPENKENKDIVIIGFNSPFNEFYLETDVVFCQDICHEIDWLKHVRSTFRHSTMGVVFCCSGEDVRSSKHLNGFPQKMKNKIPETTVTPPQLPNFYESTTLEYNENVEINEDY